MAKGSNIENGDVQKRPKKFKFLLIVMLLVVISVIVTLNLFFYQTHEAEMAYQINRQQLLIAKTIAMSIDNTMEHLKEEIVSLSGLLSERGLQKKRLDDFIRYAFEELNEDIKIDIVIFDTKGSVLLATDEDYKTEKEDDDLYANALSIPPGQVNMLPSGEQFLELKVITPIRKQSDLMGAIMMVINIEDFNKKFLEPIKAGQRGYAWVMDESGTLVFHPSMPEMIGRNIRTHTDECYECHTSFNAEQKILESPDVGYSAYIAPYGEDKLLAFSRTSQIGWIVCISIPYSEVTSSMKNSMRLQSMLVLTIFLSTVTVAFIIMAINRQRLKAEAKAIYADKLKQYATALEEVVNERTKELKSEKEKMDAVVGSVSAGICIFNEQGECLWVNKVMEGWLSAEKATSLTLKDLHSEGIGSGEIFRSVIHEGLKQETTSLDLGNKGGTFHISISPFHMPDGSTQVLLLLQDVTELKMAEEQMIQSDKLTALSRLSAGVAHEIGNPLTSISSYVQILKEMEFDDFTTEALDTVSKHIKRIENILRKMSSFSKSKEDEVGNHSVSELVNSTVELVRYDRRTKNIEIDVDISKDVPEVVVNGSQMTQVITNLILNAADAMGEGGRLTIGAKVSDGDVLISFKDTGQGISEEHLKKIFDPFFTTKQSGTGLGLAVSHSITKSFGGTLEVESELGAGTTFTVRLAAYEG
jgi:signal transduction histidine kinase